MKKLHLALTGLALAAVMSSCASEKDSTFGDLPSDQPSASTEAAGQAPSDMPPPLGEKTNDAALASPAADPSLPAPTPLGDGKTMSEATPPAPMVPTPPAPEGSPAVPEVTGEPNLPVPTSVPLDQAPSKHTLREDYEAYRKKSETKNEIEQQIENRALFAHEGGSWQIGLDFAFSAFPDYDFDSTGNGTATGDSMGALLSVSYFPLNTIDTGRLGVGLIGGAYFSKIDNINGADFSGGKNRISAISAGVRATYEFQYWIAQTLVPFAYVGYDQLNFRSVQINTTSLPKSNLRAMNYGLGLNLNLNRIEPAAASKALASTGIRKFYLAYTFMTRSASVETGPSHFIGLKFEY
jgi:hypothetical protein